MEADEEQLKIYVSHRLKAKRKSLGLHQDDVAELTGLQRTTIANVEANRQRLPLHVLYLMCAALKLEVADVLPSVTDIVSGSDNLKVTVEGVAFPLAPKTHEMLQSLMKDGPPVSTSINDTLQPNAFTMLRALQEEGTSAHKSKEEEDRDGS